jgi:hypothetical protein
LQHVRPYAYYGYTSYGYSYYGYTYYGYTYYGYTSYGDTWSMWAFGCGAPRWMLCGRSVGRVVRSGVAGKGVAVKGEAIGLQPSRLRLQP